MDTMDAMDGIMEVDYGRGRWMTFTADHDPRKAVAAFVQRFGVRPAHVGVDRRWKLATLKVGPAPEMEVVL